jgi:hypothetical protein
MIPAADFAPGTILGGRYRIVSLLGRGGLGEVYHAEDLTIDFRRCAQTSELDWRKLARFSA